MTKDSNRYLAIRSGVSLLAAKAADGVPLATGGPSLGRGLSLGLRELWSGGGLALRDPAVSLRPATRLGRAAASGAGAGAAARGSASCSGLSKTSQLTVKLS